MKSLQETYAPNNICFGCGANNPNGLQLRSFWDSEQLIAQFQPQLHHQAFEGILNGGIIGTLLDCHCNWMAAMHLMKLQELDSPPCTVTAEYSIKMKKPTPILRPVELRAWVLDASQRRATISGSITVNGDTTATCDGVFVAVKPGHPAFHRW
jgi:acyl-coenzyme A thioesterase PaaI-like protein